MTKVKLILGGITGAVGLAGAALVPSLMNSDKKIDSGEKAVAKSWSANTNKGTTFRNFGSAFAPFLVDVDKTDDAFWAKRVEQTKTQGFDSGTTFSGWTEISDVNARISKIKEGCRSFQSFSLSYYSGDTQDIQSMMKLCGIYDSSGKEPQITLDSSKLTSSKEQIKAEEICGLLVSGLVKGSCQKIGVTATGTEST